MITRGLPLEQNEDRSLSYGRKWISKRRLERSSSDINRIWATQAAHLIAMAYRTRNRTITLQLIGICS